MTRHDILASAERAVTGGRQEDYGTPEKNFEKIAALWNQYLGAEKLNKSLSPVDVAAMMALLKLARIGSGRCKADNWIDLAGYAACGGEIQIAQEGEISYVGGVGE